MKPDICGENNTKRKLFFLFLFRFYFFYVKRKKGNQKKDSDLHR